jgi:FKBP-type peptidyl-prolyl cis-trans isomerase FkpA
MIKKILSIAVIGAALVGNYGCKNDSGFKKIHGIEYKIVKDVPGKTAQKGDVIEVNLIAKVDSMELGNSWKQGRPMPSRVEDVKNNADYQAVFPYLSVGDSAIIQISCDSILKTVPPGQTQLPPWLKKGKKIIINLSVVSIKSMDDYMKEMKSKQEEMKKQMEQKAAAQMPIDDKALQDYFAKNNIKATKAPSGLYYTIQKPGSGANIAPGQVVGMMYTGKTLDGKAFDSNVDTSVGHHGTKPLEFQVGAHQMIPGVDEGATLFKKGTKATLYLPSPLGYGEQGNPPVIGPNAILIFDIEITEVKEAPKNAPGQGEGPGNPGQAQ